MMCYSILVLVIGLMLRLYLPMCDHSSSNENALLHQKFDELGENVVQNITNIDIDSLKSDVISYW